MIQEPKTQAGRARDRLFDDVDKRFGRNVARFVDHRIPAIEAEAAAPYEERLRILIKAVEDHMADPSDVAEADAAPAARPDDPWPNDGEEWEDTSEPAAAEPPDERGKRLIAYLADAWATSLTDYPERSQQQIAAREAYHDALEAARSLFGERAAQPPPPDRCDVIVNNGMGEPTECGRMLPCSIHERPACPECGATYGR